MAFLKVSNETKVGALAAVSITLLILGFNFLKGKNLTRKSRYLLAKFEKIDGLVEANPVMMNGLTIGSVYGTKPGNENLDWILVTIRLDQNVNIPENSVATIKTNILGTTTMEIQKGNATAHLKPGDTLQSKADQGLLGGVMSQIAPTQRNLDNVLKSADSVLLKVDNVFDAKAQANLSQTLANLSIMSANLAAATTSLNAMLNPQTGTLTKSMASLQTFTGSLGSVSDKLPKIVTNLETATQSLSKLELDKTLQSVDKSLASLNDLLAKASSANSSVGALLNDRKLYNNLSSTINSLNLLMQDLRMHPKRYVNISVFGKKNTAPVLMRPMQEDSVTQEQKP